MYLTTANRLIAVMPSRVPARLFGAPSADRRMPDGTAAFADGIHTPAFLKDVAPGVRAWRPPA